MERLKAASTWSIIVGVLSIIGGFLALVFPLAGALVVTVWTAFGFVLLGVAQIIHAFQLKDWQGFIPSLLFGILAVLLGVVLYVRPLEGAVSLAILTAILLAVLGISKIMIALRIRPHRSWGWLAASGVLSILIALMMFMNFPAGAVAMLGTLLGIELLFTGAAMLATGLQVRAA